jgi:hypothetical protein
VYHEDRLSVVKNCMTVTGTVMSVTPEDDGDTHFDLALDTADAKMLTPANMSAQHGWLVVEIVPADKPGCTPGQPPKPPEGTYNYGLCSGADLNNPTLGSHVKVTGPYVLDEDHGGWAEIHPVWHIDPVSGASGAAPAPSGAAPTPPATKSSPASAPSAGVSIVSVTSPVDDGADDTLVAQTSANAACTLGVTLPSKRQSQSSGLGPATADATGKVTWTWMIGTNTRGGTAIATVTCGSDSTTGTFEIKG